MESRNSNSLDNKNEEADNDDGVEMQTPQKDTEPLIQLRHMNSSMADSYMNETDSREPLSMVEWSQSNPTEICEEISSTTEANLTHQQASQQIVTQPLVHVSQTDSNLSASDEMKKDTYILEEIDSSEAPVSLPDTELLAHDILEKVNALKKAYFTVETEDNQESGLSYDKLTSTDIDYQASILPSTEPLIQASLTDSCSHDKKEDISIDEEVELSVRPTSLADTELLVHSSQETLNAMEKAVGPNEEVRGSADSHHCSGTTKLDDKFNSQTKNFDAFALDVEKEVYSQPFPDDYQTPPAKMIDGKIEEMLPKKLHPEPPSGRAVPKVLFNTVKQKKISKTKRAGLVMSVPRVLNKLKKGRYAQRVGDTSAVYLAAVLEYMLAEILELAGNCARFFRKKRITPRCVQLSLLHDKELDQLTKGVIVPGGGVRPYIHPVLLGNKDATVPEVVKIDNEDSQDGESAVFPDP